MKMSALRLPALAAAVSLLPQAAFAHTFGAEGAGLSHGLMHPVGGWDHMLAMVAIGLWAAQRGGRALWLLPVAFVSSMVFGGFLGMNGIALPQAELGIVLSVIVLGALIAVQARLPLAACLVVGAGFGMFHGHAHGAEMPEAAAPVLYGTGFVLSTALLHASGIIAALAARNFAREAVAGWVVRGVGALFGAAGLALMAA